MGQDTWEQLIQKSLLFLPRLGTALLVLLVFWLLARGLARVVLRLTVRGRLDTGLARYLAEAARIFLLLFGVVTALGTLGLDVTALVAGLGLTTFALGFALRDILSNALSGVLVLLYKPFHVGDHISVKGLEGKVIEINLRYTVLEQQSKRMLIPSSLLFSEPVTVVAAKPAKSAIPETISPEDPVRVEPERH